MDDIARISECIKQLQDRLEKLSRSSLKEAQTRVIFIDPLLTALGWDVNDPGEVDMEHTTVDGKAVDYALKINSKVVLLVEAKSLDDSLTDVKAITQVVGYASNEGVEWCVLTNGVTYKIYRSTEKVSAPEKLLFKVSLDPKASEHLSLDQIAELLNRLSPRAVEDGVLEELLTRDKIRKALDKLLSDPPSKLVGMVRATTGDDSLKVGQIEETIKNLWQEQSIILHSRAPSPKMPNTEKAVIAEPERTHKRAKTIHPPVKDLDGRILGNIYDFAQKHSPPLKYEGMRTAIDVLTACKSPDGSDYDFHYDVDYRKDGVYIVRKQGPGYRTFPKDVDEMRNKAGL